MNQVTEKKEGALATFDMEADAAQGAQNISQEDLALPFLKILGQLSPEVNKRDGKYVEGAEPGKIINTVTNALYDSIEVVPCHYKRQYIEWADRGTSTGAPVAIHEADSDIVSQTTRGKDYKDRLPNGNYLEETAYYYVMVENKQGGYSPALITMKSTQLSVSKKWNSMMKSVQIDDGKGGFAVPPMHGVVYNLQSNLQKNDKGSWYGWVVTMDRIMGQKDKSLYLQSKEFNSSASKGNVQTKADVEEKSTGAATPF